MVLSLASPATTPAMGAPATAAPPPPLACQLVTLSLRKQPEEIRRESGGLENVTNFRGCGLSSVPEFSFENLLAAGAGLPVVGLAGYLDLRVFSGNGRSREVHGGTAPRSRPESPAADSAAIFGVVPHLVVLVLLEFGHVPHLELDLQVLSDLVHPNLTTSLRSQGRSSQGHTGRGIIRDRSEEASAQNRDDRQRGSRRDPEPPRASGAGRALT